MAKEKKIPQVSKQEITDVLTTACRKNRADYLIVRRDQLKTALGSVPASVIHDPEEDGKSELVKVNRTGFLEILEKPIVPVKKENETKRKEIH